MATTFKFGNGNWAVKEDLALAYNDENGNFKPLPFDFTRASSATRVNKNGLIETVPSGKPRIDFLNNTSGHLLLEPSRTNLLTYSEDFSNAVWAKSNTTITSNDVISPDGSQTADLCNYTIGGSYINTGFASSGNTDVTVSVFVKANTVSVFRIRESFYIGSSCVYDLTAVSAGSGGTIENYGNGWYKCSFTYNLGVGQNNINFIFDLNTNVGSVYLWGAQCELGSYATSYIPTEGSSVTRVREICEQDSLSNLIGQTEGVIYYDYTATFESPSTSFDFFPISVSDGTTSNFFFLNNYNQRLTIGYNVSGTSIISNNSFTFNSGDRIKVAFAYKQNDFAVYINGAQILTLGSGSVAALSEVTLGNYYNNQTTLQDDVKVNELRFYDTRLTNTELQNLTS